MNLNQLRNHSSIVFKDFSCNTQVQQYKRYQSAQRFPKILQNRQMSVIREVSSNTITTIEENEQIIIERPQQLLDKVIEKFGLTPRIRGLILLNILTLLMASNWVVVKESEIGFDPFTFAMMRFGVASIALVPFVFQNRGVFFGQKPVSLETNISSKMWKAGIELGFWSAMGYMTQAIGLMETDASRASLISTFTVILVPVLAGLSGRGVKPLTWAAGILAIFGVSMLEEGGGHPPNMGDLWSLISAVGFALQVFRTETICRGECGKHVMKLLGITVFVTFIFSALTTAIMHPAGFIDACSCFQHGSVFEGSFVKLLQECPAKEILYTGLLTTDAVLLIEMFALHDVSSVEAAIIYTAEPVLGAALAYVFLGERWGPMGWVGAGLILASSLGAQILGSEEEENNVNECEENENDERCPLGSSEY
eukprot:TRINITY_DN1613_c1_g1_i1.p1 TRINITY_DN1613_c1_g1~~TRINITY_DN1613_c1_g1_i1.p1  ORF type:complete len:478 (-),score=50.12 TRINITY_DN1613_c1_g1_i1:1191-2462(-)